MKSYETFYGIQPHLKHLHILGGTSFSKRGRSLVTKLTKEQELCKFLGCTPEHHANQVLWTTDMVIGLSRTLTFDEDGLLQNSLLARQSIKIH